HQRESGDAGGNNKGGRRTEKVPVPFFPPIRQNAWPMERKAFGWTGVQVPVIGQGTWRMGESRLRREQEIRAVALGIDLGLTHIDTAEMYGGGEAEEIIAAATRGRRRADLFIASKVLQQNASHRGT